MIFMTLILDLPPELEQYLLQSSEDRGVTMEALTLQVLTSMMNGQNQSLIKPGTVCEVWSPYEAFEAADTMLKVLRETTAE
jgi:hypothetical protein